jgi:hypothetical protein
MNTHTTDTENHQSMLKPPLRDVVQSQNSMSNLAPSAIEPASTHTVVLSQGGHQFQPTSLTASPYHGGSLTSFLKKPHAPCHPSVKSATKNIFKSPKRKFSEQQTNSHEDNVPRKSAELMPHRRPSRRPEQGFHLKTTTKEKLHGDASNVENDACRRSRCDITTLKQTISLTRVITGRYYRSTNTNNTSHT